jgi:CubicO group peptidase (beta-lactamase class C family)
MAELSGTCDSRFDAVRDALQRNIDSGEDVGASIVVDLDGEIAVDLWGGFRDEGPSHGRGARSPTSGPPPRP